MSIMDSAVHFYSVSLKGAEMLKQVYYQDGGQFCCPLMVELM